jgi:ribosomal protein S19E (S16A)
MTSAALSDKGAAVFAFAAYHQLASGETVAEVVLHDRAGHAADPRAIRELESAGLARTEHDRAVFTQEGQALLAKVVEAIRSAGR